jgi:pentatricopeptide repeat protein
LLDPQASVDLPSANLVTSRQLDNRELDKLFAALGRNKATWRRALVLHEWLLSMGHTPDDRLCTTLIRVCSQHGQAMTALSLYDWMRSSHREGGAGLVCTVYTYTAAMRAALTGNMIDRAIKVSNTAHIIIIIMLRAECGSDPMLLCMAARCIMHWELLQTKHSKYLT